jgi:transcriptional regulator with XRE-family HTH domain
VENKETWSVEAKNTFVGVVAMDGAGVVSEVEHRRLFDNMLANRGVRELRQRWHDGYLEAERRVARNIRDQRARSGMSQEQVARGLQQNDFDFHQSTVAKVESGKRPLRLAELFAFADVLDVPWTALLEGGRDIDIFPEEGMLPIDVWEANLEELISQREDVMAEIAQEVEEKARRYAEVDRMILIRISALANAAAKASRQGLAVDRERVDGLVEKWTKQAASSAMSRATYEQNREDIEHRREEWDLELKERKAKEEVMWIEFKQWQDSRSI